MAGGVACGGMTITGGCNGRQGHRWAKHPVTLTAKPAHPAIHSPAALRHLGVLTVPETPCTTHFLKSAFKSTVIAPICYWYQ